MSVLLSAVQAHVCHYRAMIAWEMAVFGPVHDFSEIHGDIPAIEDPIDAGAVSFDLFPPVERVEILAFAALRVVPGVFEEGVGGERFVGGVAGNAIEVAREKQRE